MSRIHFFVPDVICDLQIPEESSKHEELVKSQVCRVNSCIRYGLELILKIPWIVSEASHRELG